MLHPYRPRIRFEKEKFQDLFGFGRWVLGSSILVFLITQGDDIFVGKMLGVAALGFYQMAYLISNLSATEITHVISQVTFPAYSKLQDDLTKLREAYLKILQLTTFISIPLAGGIFIFAPEFTKIFLGDKWMPMVPAIEVLVLAGLLRSISATTGPVFQAVGKPEIVTKWQPVRLFVLLAVIYPFTVQWGILGTSLAVVSCNLISTVGFSVKVVRIIQCDAGSFLKRIILPSINTLAVISIIVILKNTITTVRALELILLIGISILIYLGATYISDKKTFLDIKKISSVGKEK
jgi:O-antigen/teichoic acid export membrane protein